MMPSGSKQELSGRTLSFAPKVTASLTPTVTLPLGRYLLQTAVDWLYQGDQYTDIDLDPHTFEPAHSTYSARISLIDPNHGRSEEHTSELQSLMRISYAVFCLKKKNTTATHIHYNPYNN